MTDKVFSVNGNKISSLLIDDEGLKFSSKSYNSVNEFQEAWVKTLSLATKVNVKYDSIKSIKKEESDIEVKVSYKTSVGITSNCEFSFADPADYEVFFSYFEKQHYYQRINETLTPFNAIKNYVVGIIAVIGITVFSYYQAVGIQEGSVESGGSGRSRLFYTIIEFLGDKGVIAVGGLISLFIAYKIWSRFKNPPNQVSLLPPNS